MALQLQSAALIGFAALLLLAAFEDLRRLVIPNALTLAMCVLWPLDIAAAPSLYGVLGSLGCALAVFLAGAVCFSRGYVGGGDVKLLAAAALWAGPAGTFPLLVVTGVLGGVLALLLLVPPGAYVLELTRAKLGPADGAVKLPPKSRSAIPVPYGIAIAAAALIVTCLPHFR